MVLITDSVPPACAKPPLRWLQAGESAVEKDVENRTLTKRENAVGVAIK